MAAVNSTPTIRPVTRRHVKARECLPVYGASDGVLSFRNGLRARERSVVDRALEIVGRRLREPGTSFNSPDAVNHYLRLALAGESSELFSVLYLDAQNRATAFETHFRGTLTQTSVYPREIVRAALAHGAASVVLSHNHPSGTPNPSRADKALTQTLKAALALVDVRVLDHVIVGGDQTFSMALSGLL